MYILDVENTNNQPREHLHNFSLHDEYLSSIPQSLLHTHTEIVATLETEIDASTLLDKPADLEAWRLRVDKDRQILQLRRAEVLRRGEEAEDVDHAHVGRALNRLSQHLGLGATGQDPRLDEAIALSEEAIAIWEELGRRRAVVLANIRHATLLERAEAYEQADALYERLANEIEQEHEMLQMYEDFLYEARGRGAAARGKPDAARRWLERALEVRQERGVEAQVARSRLFLHLLEAH